MTEDRRTLVHLVRSGKSIAQAAKQLGRSRAWGYKWHGRYQARQDWQALEDCSRRPRHSPRRLAEEIRKRIRQVRSELGAEAQDKDGLGYIGAAAIRGRLQEQSVEPLPSLSSIERVLRQAGTRVRKQAEEEVVYPPLQPDKAHPLIQADILPRFLTGGAETACFNAMDVVSKYAGGRQDGRRTAANACDFLWRVWQEQGFPTYQQVDKEGLL